MLPREAVVRAYIRWLRNPLRIDTLAERELSNSSWDERDRRLYLELLYGVIRWKGRLDWLLEQLNVGRQSIRLEARAAAEVGLYQLLFLDRIPDWAAVDGVVETARRLGGPSSAGWTNAILRRVTRERDYWKQAQPAPPQLEDYILSVHHSHPLWLVARWRKNLPADKLTAFLEWNNRRPKVSLRVNRLKTTAQDLLDELKNQGFAAAQHLFNPDFVVLEHKSDVHKLNLLNEGRAIAQDVGQGFVSILLGPQPGEEILDLCAAPGGKTTHLAQLCSECRIVATDRSEERLALVSQAVRRCGCPNVEILAYDEVINSKWQFDAVLVDAPCTGTGVLARRADLRWRRQPDDIPRMAGTQLNLLHYATDRLKPAGRIIYSTCSVEPEENWRVVERFLSERRAFCISSKLNSIPVELFDANRCLNILGPECECDGVFAVSLVKGDTA